MSHTDCRPASQNATITTTMARVNSGSRNEYERARKVLKPCNIGIVGNSSDSSGL